MILRKRIATAMFATFAVAAAYTARPAHAQEEKPNIVIIWGDDVGR